MNVYTLAEAGILGIPRCTMRDFCLTAAQRRRLEQQLRETTEAGVFRRTLAVLEAAGGEPVAALARLLRTSRTSVYHWLESYRSWPDPGSLTDHRGGNHPTLWTEELQALLAASLEQRPDDFGYPAVEWTVPLLQEHLARYGGVRPGETALRQQLHQQGYVWKRPRYVLEPDPEAEKKTPHPPATAGPAPARGQALRG
jgi:transposase